ncbi:major capsid protein [Rhizobium sp. 1399]|uniref:major capsid protein n=1 Tax=Rhizobium sp. 1399 TaxID=2817758 RepID=UPI002854850A|nr:major capsid protein [Rhizobium sp. 1399]MDR6664024.1 hypothetical protein [Rhizobium sp. 1399]
MSFANIIRGDAFSFTSLTSAVNKILPEPEGLDTIFTFNEKGINTLTALVEYKDGKLGLVPTSERGSVGKAISSNRRTARPIFVPHYQEFDAIMATEVQGVRQFGSESEFETVMSKLTEKQTDMVTKLNRTLNYAKAGMIQGYLFDADGSVIYDWHQELGFTRNSFEFDITNPNINIRDIVVKMKRQAEVKLGGYTYSRFVWLLPPEMFDLVVAHVSLKEAFDRWQDGAWNRADNRKGFVIADNVEIRSYDVNTTGALDGSGNPIRMFPADKSYLVPDSNALFQVRYAPADTMEAANTIGLPYYSASEPKPFNKGVDVTAESNFVVYSEKPDAIVEVTFAD